MRRFLFASLAVLILASVVPAFGDDVNPPPWRGQPGTTFGMWEFSNNNPNPLPEPGYVYPWGLPATQVTPGPSQEWLPEWNGRLGVWPLSGQIVVEIPNRPQPLPHKDIWIQLTWAQQATNVWPAVSETRFGVRSTLISEVPLPNGWFQSTYQITLIPNPDWERILITGEVNVDEMVIDTICIPEPGSLIALLSGLVGLVGFAAKRRR